MIENRIIPGIQRLASVEQQLAGDCYKLNLWELPLYSQDKCKLSKSPKNMEKYLLVKDLERESASSHYDEEVVDIAMKIADLTGNDPGSVLWGLQNKLPDNWKSVEDQQREDEEQKWSEWGKIF